MKHIHLQPGGVRVRKGDRVKAGRRNRQSSVPLEIQPNRIHFHVCDSNEPLMSAGIPRNFRNVTIQWADVPRPIQSGDVIIAK